jgi:hypothetical protein
MRNTIIALIGGVVLLLVGIVTQHSDATTLTGTIVQPDVNYSIVQKAGCGPLRGLGIGKCPAGEHWIPSLEGCVSCDLRCSDRCRRGKILYCRRGSCYCKSC